MIPAVLLVADAEGETRMLGESLVTLQLERARSIGVGHVIVLATRITQPLLQDLEAVRQRGLRIDLARSPEDAAGLLHPDESVLLVAELGRLVALEVVAALIDQPPPHLLCVGDAPETQHLERIDATRRWTGLAMVDGALVRGTVAMLGEWDLGSTLARRALQSGAASTVIGAERHQGEIAEIVGAADALTTAQRLVRATPAERGGWGTTYVTGWLGRLASRLSAALDLAPRLAMLVGYGLAAAAAVAAGAGWIAASLVLFLLAATVEQAASISGRAATGRRPFPQWRGRPLAAVGAFVLLAMGTTLMFRTEQWGCALLGLWAVGVTAMADALLAEDAASRRWRADLIGHALVGLAGLALGAPAFALALAALHATIGLLYAERAALARLARS